MDLGERSTKIKSKYKYLYIIKCREDDSVLKVGISNHPKGRLRSLQSASWNELFIWAYFGMYSEKDCFQLEQRIHLKLRKHSIRGEWFRVQPHFIWKILDTSHCVFLDGFGSVEMTEDDVLPCH